MVAEPARADLPITRLDDLAMNFPGYKKWSLPMPWNGLSSGVLEMPCDDAAALMGLAALPGHGGTRWFSIVLFQLSGAQQSLRLELFARIRLVAVVLSLGHGVPRP
jgi:hypothetical protein